MAKGRAARRDPMDSLIVSALAPGDYIGWNEGFSFCANLRHLEGEIAKVADADPARAVTLYETVLAGCNAKAEDVGDSDGGAAIQPRRRSSGVDPYGSGRLWGGAGP